MPKTILKKKQQPPPNQHTLYLLLFCVFTTPIVEDFTRC